MRRTVNQLQRARRRFDNLAGTFELPMTIRDVIWVPVFFIGLLAHLTTGWALTLAVFEAVIWVAYIVEFLVKLSDVPRRCAFFEEHLPTFGIVFLPLLPLFS